MKAHEFTTFNRDEFVKAWNEEFGDIDYLYDLCVDRTMKYPYILFYAEDTYIVLNVDTGIIITWYKHLGRAATCNKAGFSDIDLRYLIRDLKTSI